MYVLACVPRKTDSEVEVCVQEVYEGSRHVQVIEAGLVKGKGKIGN